MSNQSASVDVLIVGSGPVGAAIARTIHAGAPQTRILMVEAGGVIGEEPGKHLLDSVDPAVRSIFERRARNALQATYVADSALAVQPGNPRDLPAGIVPAHLAAMRTDTFPGAAVAWNVGGMASHWTAACPWITGSELIDFIPRQEWNSALQSAQAVLDVQRDAFPMRSAVSAELLDRLAVAFPERVPGRGVQPMPMAGSLAEDGRFHRTSSSTILPAIAMGGVASFELRVKTACVQITRAGDGSAAGATLLDIDSGELSSVEAGTVVVAADALRSPQLLWASDIRPAALGRYLNEHVTVAGSVVIDAERMGFGRDDTLPAEYPEPFVGAYWLPSNSPEQPVHGQMMETMTAEGEHRLGLAYYAATEVRAENRLVFSDDKRDRLGLPELSVHFSRSAPDREAIAIAQSMQQRAGTALGGLEESSISVLEPGSSLHYTGTTRMGPMDDGRSVCNSYGEVWGSPRVYVAGNGVVPTALTCNSTLTAVALAVRTAHAIVADLAR